MVSTSFIFGGKDMPKTPQELARMRAMAEALAPRRTPQNVGEGIAAIGNALAMRMMMSRADKAENAGLKSAEDAYSSLFSTPETVDQTTSTPDLTPPTDTSIAPMIKSPQDAVDAAPAKPVSSDVASMEAYIRQAATARGMDPDTAVRVARSEGLAPGVWQSRVKKNGAFEPSYGPFQMLVGDGTNFPKGMGNDFMAKTGLDPTDPKNANAMIDFALDRAKEGGWSPWYGAKKAGIERWQGINANEVAGLPDAANALQSTETEGAVSVAPVPDGFQGEDPLAARKPSTKVAQALTRRRVDTEKAFQVLSDPFLPEGKRAVLQSLIKRQFDEDNARLKQELEQADPKYKLELEKGQLELQKLKNPEKARRLTEEEEKKGGLDTSGVYDILPDGSTKVVQEPKKRNTVTVNGQVIDVDTKEVIAEVPQQVSPIEQDSAKLAREKFEFEKNKPTQDIQEYQFYEEREKAAGREPLGPLEWDQARRKSSASQVNIENKTEGEFEKTLAKGQAEAFNKMADEGINARADLDIVNQLETLMKGQGGMGTGLAATISSWGIPFKGSDDLQAAEALINKLVPTQRQQGSGTMSDRDVELFKASLPSLWNQPGGNEKILGIMRGLAEYKQNQGEIADMVLMGEMTRQEARRALKKIPNPLEEFRKTQDDKKEEKSAPPPDPEFEGMSDEELERLINGGQ